MAQFRMPSLGADMDAGTLLEWLVKPGDEVHRGDIVAVVDTDKAAIDVETFDDGVVQRLLVEPGTRVPVGAPLADIGATPGLDAVAAGPTPAVGPVLRHLAETLGVDLHAVSGTGRGGRITRADIARAAEVAAPAAVATGAESTAAEAATAAAAEPSPAPAREARAATGTPRGEPSPAAAREARARITPYARRRAAELGIDLAGLQAETSAGTLHAADVEAAASAVGEVPQPTLKGRETPTTSAPTTSAPTTSTPTTSTPTTRATAAAGSAASAAQRGAAMRRAIAKLMTRSNAEIPHYYLTATVDLSRSVEWLREHNAGVPVTDRIVMAAVFAKATARAAAEVPGLNGWWVDDEFRPSERVNLGIPVSLREGGLVTPAIREADTLELPEVMARLRDLVDRARRGTLRASELTDATLTMTNLGDRGAESVQGVIYPPQVALVGYGRVVQRPWAVDGLIGVRPLVTVTLAGDHRASDGHLGGLVLEVIDRLLTHPEVL